MDIDYKMLVKEIMGQISMTQKDVTPPPRSDGYGHGLGGLFSYPGLERPVFSAMVLPALGLQSMLPVRGSLYDNPLYGIFTGVTATTGSEPVGVCDDPPTVGLAKLCMHSFVFGRQSRQTPVFDLDRMGRLVNRGESVDLQFMGNPWRNSNPNVPTIPGMGNLGGVLNAEVGKALFEFAVAWARDFAGELYTGNPANNTAGGGRKYAYGLDILINTGYRDAESGQVCPAADSIVYNANSLEVNTNGTTYVRRITNIMRNLKIIAEDAGLDPARWVIAMRRGLFYELSEIWPCAYATYRCQTGLFSATQSQTVDTQWMIDMRDSMRDGKYLLIDGEQVPVVLDQGIAETALAGSSFSSSIYFVPLTVLGGTPVTFLEHLSYDAPNGAMDAARAMAPDGMFYTTDGGRFLWHRKPPTNFCVQLLAKTEPRVMLLTPHIAARMTNVKYTPVEHERDWEVDNSFYVDGGRTARDIYGPSFYSPNA